VRELDISFSHGLEIMKNMVIFLILCVILSGSFFLLYNFSANAIAQFLYVNKPIDDAEVLLVEGWVPKRFLGYVKEEFDKGSYGYILVSGMNSQYVSDPDDQQMIYSNASIVAHQLITMGIDTSKIIVVNCFSTNIHKTFSMALATRRWVNLNNPTIKRINIVTTWSHGKKTWCAYQRVFGDSIKVGILTYPMRQLPISQWWLTRSGFRYQMYSLVGYIYAALWPVALLDEGRYY
jgi:hypothetical protein